MKRIIRSFLSRYRPALLAGLLAALLLPGAALAGGRDGDSNLLAQRFQFGLGTFVNGSSLNIRVDGEAGEIGTPVNWDKTIGDRDDSRFRFDGLWRVSERHHLRLMFTDYLSSAERRIDEEIIWDGDLIPVGVLARGTFGFEVFEAAYEYAFVQRPDLEIAGSVGLHYTRLEATLLADVQVDGEETVVERGGTADVDAPLPVFGARGQWRLGTDVYADVLGQAFYLSVGDYTGRILNLRAALLWQFRPRVGVGLGYDWFRVDIDSDADDFQGAMDWTYEGPQVFLNVAF